MNIPKQLLGSSQARPNVQLCDLAGLILDAALVILRCLSVCQAALLMWQP